MALCPALWMGLSRRRRWDGARWTAAAARAAPLCLGGRRLGLRATGAPKRVRLLWGGGLLRAFRLRAAVEACGRTAGPFAPGRVPAAAARIPTLGSHPPERKEKQNFCSFFRSANSHSSRPPMPRRPRGQREP